MSVHKIEVRNRAGGEGKLTTGANTEILLDGKPLQGITFFKFEAKPSKIAKVCIEMVAEVGIDLNAKLNLSDPKPTEFVAEGKPLELYTLSSHGALIAEVEKYKQIKAALLLGGMVYSDRASGKSRTIAEILKEDLNTVVICDTVSQRDFIRKYAPGVSKDRILINSVYSRDHIKAMNSKVFIDEYNPQNMYPPFFAAVTSRVAIIK